MPRTPSSGCRSCARLPRGGAFTVVWVQIGGLFCKKFRCINFKLHARTRAEASLVRRLFQSGGAPAVETRSLLHLGFQAPKYEVMRSWLLSCLVPCQDLW